MRYCTEAEKGYSIIPLYKNFHPAILPFFCTAIQSSCHYSVLPSGHPAILLYCHPVILPLFRTAIRSSCHSSVLPSGHPAILPYCHPVILPFFRTAIRSSCHSSVLPSCHRSILPLFFQFILNTHAHHCEVCGNVRFAEQLRRKIQTKMDSLVEKILS